MRVLSGYGMEGCPMSGDCCFFFLLLREAYNFLIQICSLILLQFSEYQIHLVINEKKNACESITEFKPTDR